MISPIRFELFMSSSFLAYSKIAALASLFFQLGYLACTLPLARAALTADNVPALHRSSTPLFSTCTPT